MNEKKRTYDCCSTDLWLVRLLWKRGSDREWFRKHPDLSDDLKEYQMMFGYFDEGMPLDHEAEEHVENAHQRLRHEMRHLWLSLSMAASIALLIGFAILWVGRQTGHQDDSKMAQLDGRTTQEDVDSAVVHEEKSTDANLSMPEKIKKSGDSVSPKTREHGQRQYRQHLFAPTPPKLWIAQNIATDSLLAEPEKLADAHLREMETQQNEMFFKLYLVDALQTQSLNARNCQCLVRKRGECA